MVTKIQERSDEVLNEASDWDVEKKDAAGVNK